MHFRYGCLPDQPSEEEDEALVTAFKALTKCVPCMMLPLSPSLYVSSLVGEPKHCCCVLPNRLPKMVPVVRQGFRAGGHLSFNADCMYMTGIHRDVTNVKSTGGRVLCNYANDRVRLQTEVNTDGVDILFRRGTALMQAISPATYGLFSAFKAKLQQKVEEESRELDSAGRTTDKTRESEPSFADSRNVLNNSGVAGNYTNCVHSDPDYASFCYVFRKHTHEYHQATQQIMQQ